MSTIKVHIGEGSELGLFGLKNLVESDANLECAGAYFCPEELLKGIAPHQEPLVLLDFTSPGFTIDNIVEIKRTSPQARILAITPDQNSSTIVSALRVGVMSYIKKDCSIGEIKEAIEETGKGNAFFCGQILETIEGEDINVKELHNEPLSCAPVSLSPREIEIICLIAEGNTNVQIAEKLILSSHTINTHRKNIMAKLGVNNTAAIVMYAIKAQWVSPNKYLFSSAK